MRHFLGVSAVTQDKLNFVLHIPRTWEGAELAWCGRDLSKINAWCSRVEFLNAEDAQSCKHCLTKYRAAPASSRDFNWFHVEELQKKSFQGHPLSDEEMKLCRLALKANPDRYRNYTVQLREEYKQSLRGGL